MSRLLVITRPALVTGFQLAGVNAHGAEDAESAQELIARWLDAGETGLLGIDDSLLRAMDPAFIGRLQAAEQMPYIAIPGGRPLGAQASRRRRIIEMLRRATGFYIAFRGEEAVDEDE
jgi:vacuolar-type H+-ATPase subunit F/Vma7